jgi:hypothetical protein
MQYPPSLTLPSQHYSNFVVYEKVFSETSAYPIACGTGFRSQDSSITDTAATLSALLQLPPYSWTRAETDKALGRLNFLETSYPSDLDFENKVRATLTRNPNCANPARYFSLRLLAPDPQTVAREPRPLISLCARFARS